MRLTQDMVCIEYKDESYLQDECREGAELGFDGKQAIHPAQVPVLRHAFSPSEAEIETARAILAAYEEAVKHEHKGAVGLSHHGRDLMIDTYA